MKKKKASLTEQVLVQSGVILFFTFLASPFGYLIRILLSRSLQPEEYGLFYAAMASFTLFTNYLDLGFGTAALYYMPKFWLKKDFNQTWLTFIYSSVVELATSLLVALVAVGTSHWLSTAYFKNAQSLEVLPLFAVVLVLESITLCFKRLFIALNKVHYYSSFEPLRFFLAFSFSAYLFITNQASVVSFSTAWLASYLITVLFSLLLFWISLRQLLRWPSWSSSLFIQLRSLAVPSLVNNFFTQLNTNTDVIFLTMIKGVHSVGIYNVTFPILVIPTMLFAPITRIFFPLLSGLQEEKLGETKIIYLIESVLKLIPLVSLYFHVFIFLFAETTLATLFTYKWVALAKQPLLWMSVFYSASILASYLGLMLDSLGMVKQKVKVLTIVSILNLLATIPAIYFFDVIGLIIVNGIVQYFLTLYFVQLLKQQYNFSIPFGLYAKYLLFFGSLSTLVYLLGINPKTFIEFCVTGLIYTTIVGFFGLKQKIFDAHALTVFRTIQKRVYFFATTKRV